MKSLLMTLALLLTSSALADLSQKQLPSDADWYLHVSFDEMRASPAGKPLYKWLQDEVIIEAQEDLEDDLGFDFEEQVRAVTAFGTSDGDMTAFISASLTQAVKDKILEQASEDSRMNKKSSRGVTYYEVVGLDIDEDNLQVQTDDVFFSFTNDDMLVFGTNEKDFKAALRMPAVGLANTSGAMLVLNADKELIQGGVNTSRLTDNDNFSFNSKLLSQTREIAFVIGDTNGDIDVQLSITADDPEATNSLANVVRGLIGLQALAGDGSPDIRSLLNKLQVSNDSRGMTLRLVTSPQTILDIVE